MAERGESEVYEMLLGLICSLVDNPEAIRIDVAVVENFTRFSVYADPSDLPILIGRGGRTAHSIRVILGTNASRLKRHLVLDIVESQVVTK